MGGWVNGGRQIEIAAEHLENRIFKHYSYKEVDDAFLEAVANNKNLVQVQISKPLPKEGYQAIDRILAIRPDLDFRIYTFFDLPFSDLSFLKDMQHLHKLWINCDLGDKSDQIDFSILPELELSALYLDCFDLRDYSFMQNLSEGLEDLLITADTMGPGINFDCKWLLRYKKLNKLWIGKKAKKNLSCISQLPSLKDLTLRGIKLTDFSFLKEMHLERLALLWNANNDLHELTNLKDLKEIGLYRIMKLENIDFLSSMENLEVICLQDLKHVKNLPDLTRLTKLREIYLYGTGISEDNLPESTKAKLRNWYQT